jgi:glycosyltransferase involved in cell wall biosynthesis
MTFAGDGPLKPELEALAARRGLHGRVKFLGTLGNAALPALLREHDVYLSASRSDGTSLSLLEAMATGLFPIVSRIAANSAWVEDGVGGLLHRVGDPLGLARRVGELARRPELAVSAARLNRDRVLRLGDRTTNMRRLELLYRELIAKRA